MATHESASEKTIWRLEIILRTIAIKRRARNISEKFPHSPVLHYACTYTPSIWLSSAWSQRVLKWTRYRSLGWENFGLSIQVEFLEVQKFDLRLLFLLNHINILFFPREFFSFIEINFVLFFGLSIQVVFLEVQKCDLRLLFLLNHINILFFPREFFSFIEINFDLMERGSMWDYFCPQNTTSIHSRQLPSTSAPPQYLIHCFQHEWAKNQVNIYTCWGTMLFKLTT